MESLNKACKRHTQSNLISDFESSISILLLMYKNISLESLVFACYEAIAIFIFFENDIKNVCDSRR